MRFLVRFLCFFLFSTVMLSQVAAMENKQSISISRSSNLLVLNDVDGTIYKCEENVVIDIYEAIKDPIISGDGKAIILSNRHFALIDDLKNCSNGTVKISSISSKVGSLQDVNVREKIYLALDIVSARPTSFLATVARWNSRINMINLPGAYISGVPLKVLHRNGFPYYQKPRISPDGRYVSPNGNLGCGLDDYPGVWDIRKKIKIVIDENDPEDAQIRCKNLFDSH